MIKVWIMRHGEAFDDLNNTFGGWADDEPTEKAMQDAEHTVKKLKELPIEIIVSSPLKRALKPAQLFALELNLPLEVSENFKEMNRYGFLTGTSKEEAKKKYPQLVAGLQNYAFSIQGGETYNELKQRVLTGLQEVLKSEKNTLIISHGSAIKCILRELGRPLERDLNDFEIFELT